MKDLDQFDPHRATNVRIMQNKIFFVVQRLFEKGESKDVDVLLCNYLGCDNKDRKENQLDKNLSDVKTVLAKAIYVDQAVESFIQQRVFQTYKIVGANKNIYYGKKEG